MRDKRAIFFRLIYGLGLIFIVNRPIFLCSYTINDHTLVERLCQRVYFPTEPISTGHLAGMHGILLSLLKEFTILGSPLCQKFDLKAHMSTCEQNFNTLVESYDVLAIPSFESIFALIMGVSCLISRKVLLTDLLAPSATAASL